MVNFYLDGDEPLINLKTNAITITSAPVELKTGKLTGRKQLIVYPPDTGVIYWGSASVTERTGAPHKSADSPLKFIIGDNVKIYAVSDGTNRSVRVVETGIISAPPEPVSNLQATNIKQTAMTLLWTASDNAASYDIFIDGIFLANTTFTTHDVEALATKTTYKFSVKAKNHTGVSPEATINATTLKSSDDSLVFNVEFTGRAGSKTNIVYDSVNKVVCTLIGVAHDGTDGWLDNRGLYLNKQDYVTILSNTGVLSDSLDFNTRGVTFEIVAYNIRGVLFRTEPSSISSYIGSIVCNNFYKYIAAGGTEKPGNLGHTWFVDANSGINKSLNDSLHNINELNIATVRFYPDGRCNLMINGKPGANSDKPADFVDYAKVLAKSNIFIRRDQTAINTDPTTIHSFSIYNRALSDEEAAENYHSYKDSEELRLVSVSPAEVKMAPGEDQPLVVVTSPAKYAPLLFNEFESGNKGFVTVNSSGMLTGMNPGDTEIAVVSKYKDQVFQNRVKVTVGASTTIPPASSRKINGISINRNTSNLEIGQSFALMATTLPFDVMNDNLVIWQSSNPNVCSVNLGVLDGLSVGTSVITAYDSSKMYSKSFTVTVSEPVVLKIEPSEVYNVVLETYGIRSDHTDAVNTTNGIQAAMNYASANHFKKIIFPFGRYLVTPAAKTILLPTEMTIDFSNSIINIEPSAKTAKGYTMFLFDYVSHTKLMNAKIYGEADYTTLAASNEACVSVEVKEAYKSGLENCTLSKSPGFNMSTSLRLRKTGTLDRNVSKSNFEAGSIDSKGVNDNTITSNTFRSINDLDINGLGDYYMLAYSQGYFGYNLLRSRLYSIFFYDVNHLFLESQMYNLQFYNYAKPVKAKYAKIVIYQEAAPTSEDSDFKAVAFLRTSGMPIDCYIRNCIFEDNFSSGLAMCGGQSWLLEGNTFSRNGKRMPACDIDWEDGWDTMVGDIVRNNKFNSKSGITAAAGCSLVLYGNVFTQSTLTMWNRTQNYRIYSNYFNGKGDQRNISLSCQAESYFVRNILSGITYTKAINHPGASYQVRDANNTLI
ncbi:Ig-like domain-containing protein [Paenibacillus sp. BR2-3]|uniref:Ig-like domain-containing protein n=1 Tax=Paenibacillus sp. BR2-3 TaxID=3048494 RepID=UPI00397782CC